VLSFSGICSSLLIILFSLRLEMVYPTVLVNETHFCYQCSLVSSYSPRLITIMMLV
jgi:hypothetical protein